MMKKALVAIAVGVGALAWVVKAHAIDRFYGYMHLSGPEKCWSCNPTGTYILHGLIDPFSPPYNLYIINLRTGDTAKWGAYNPYDWFVNEDRVGIYYEIDPLDSNFLQIGDPYEVVVFWYNAPQYGFMPCTRRSCVYTGIITSETVRVDIKMHDPETNPTGGGGVGPSSYGSPCNPEGLKLAWIGGALRIRAEKPTELHLKLYDVSGKLLLEKTVSVKAGESSVELPVKGLNVLVVEGENFTKTLKVVR